MINVTVSFTLCDNSCGNLKKEIDLNVMLTGRHNSVSFGNSPTVFNGYSRSMSTTQTLPRLNATETQFSSNGMGRNRKPSLAAIGFDPNHDLSAMFGGAGVHGAGLYGVGCDRGRSNASRASRGGGGALTCTCYSHTSNTTTLG